MSLVRIRVRAPPEFGLQKNNQKAPDRNELEAPFGELVVAGCPLMAARTDRGGALRGRTETPVVVQFEPARQGSGARCRDLWRQE